MAKVFCIAELQYGVELSVLWILYSLLIITRIWLFIQLQFKSTDWKASGISLCSVFGSGCKDFVLYIPCVAW